ncbi:MAG: sulfatase-like hydrolase/transferase, partial [Anaerolineales bacterium]|nr:sulfatase-like hydrolase/transferase [Anaerolineales bacterium]
MTKISRRDFLMLLATAPFYKVAWSQAASSIDRLKQQTENSDTPNILFIVFDTLSAQHVSLFGYQRETTPNFARFAERA